VNARLPVLVWIYVRLNRLTRFLCVDDCNRVGVLTRGGIKLVVLRDIKTNVNPVPLQILLRMALVREFQNCVKVRGHMKDCRNRSQECHHWKAHNLCVIESQSQYIWFCKYLTILSPLYIFTSGFKSLQADMYHPKISMPGYRIKEQRSFSCRKI
jgi:hypothetical protein